MSKPDIRPSLAEAYADGRLTLEEFERGVEYQLRRGALTFCLVPRPPRLRAGSFAYRAYRSRWLPYSIAVVSLAATVGGCVLAASVPAALWPGVALLLVGCALFAALCFGGPGEE